MNLSASLVERFSRNRTAIAIFAFSATIVALLFLPQLKIDDNFDNLLIHSADRSRVLEVEPDDNACVLLLEGGPILAPDNLEAIRELVFALNDVSQVQAVHSIFDARKPIRFGRYFLPLISRSPASEEELGELLQKVLRHPLVNDKMLSDDGNVTLVYVELNPLLRGASEYQPVLNQVSEVAKRHLEGTSLSVSLTGIPALQVEMTEALKWEQISFVLGAEIVGLFISLIIFRRFAAVGVVQAGPIMAVIWSMGGMALVGEPLNVINSVLAPLVLTIALTDSVHLVLRIRAARESGSERIAAVMLALRRVGPACFLTSLTTSIAFASLATAKIEVIRRFGWACSFAVIAAFLAVITIVPLLACTRLGDNLVRPKRMTVQERNSIWAVWLDRLVTRGRVTISLMALVSTAFLLAVSTRLEPDIQMQQFLPSYGTALKALLRCDEVFGGLLPVYVVVDWDKTTTQSELLDAIGEIDSLVAAEPRMGAPLSVVGILKSLSKTPQEPLRNLSDLKLLPQNKIERIIRFDKRRALVISRIRDIGTRHALPLYEDMRFKFDELETRWPTIRFRMTGWTVESGRLSESMLSDMMTSLYIAVVISFLILVVAFRSLRLGLISLISNLFPLVATSATMVLLDFPLHFSSATVFSVCFGVAVDDTIHFISCFVHESHSGARTRISIRRTIHRVGGALVASSTIMVCAFGVVVFSSVPSIHEFSLVFMVVIAWALVGDLVFLPALLAVVSTRNSAKKDVKGKI